MDDEEEDMSRPISQLWGTPFRDVKYEDRATQIAAGQALAAVTAAVPTSQSHSNNSISIDTLPCSLLRQPRIPFHVHEASETKPACLDAPYDGPVWLSFSKRGSVPPPERRAEMKGLPAGPCLAPHTHTHTGTRDQTLRDGTVRWNTGLDFVF
ncbi:BCL2 modifying factor 2 isoform X2 [Siniperca chuatsi]|uniref:BCL2 modifying factor 2 isoform X2 n=1 Tax=Siniperca chuatsi TaxID=119488 RepID=UPI001CE05C53|nr:BCL2 modifying factor 2 isoform X2 [Siniperca chuatsi]